MIILIAKDEVLRSSVMIDLTDGFSDARNKEKSFIYEARSLSLAILSYDVINCGATFSCFLFL